MFRYKETSENRELQDRINKVCIDFNRLTKGRQANGISNSYKLNDSKLKKAKSLQEEVRNIIVEVQDVENEVGIEFVVKLKYIDEAKLK